MVSIFTNIKERIEIYNFMATAQEKGRNFCDYRKIFSFSIYNNQTEIRFQEVYLK